MEMLGDLMSFFSRICSHIFCCRATLWSEITDSPSCFTQVLRLLCSCWPRSLKERWL